MSKEETAVQILVDSLIKLGYLHSNEFGQSPKVIELIKQAKEIEKEQRISDYYQGACDESDSHGAQYICKSDAEQWYEQTYGGKK